MHKGLAQSRWGWLRCPRDFAWTWLRQYFDIAFSRCISHKSLSGRFCARADWLCASQTVEILYAALVFSIHSIPDFFLPSAGSHPTYMRFERLLVIGPIGMEIVSSSNMTDRWVIPIIERNRILKYQIYSSHLYRKEDCRPSLHDIIKITVAWALTLTSPAPVMVGHEWAWTYQLEIIAGGLLSNFILRRSVYRKYSICQSRA